MEKTLYRQFFYPNVQRCTKMGKFLEAVPRILPLEKLNSGLPTDNKITVIATTGSNREIFEIAAKVLYRLWWKERVTEEQILEIHRLALLAREIEIAAVITSDLGDSWINTSRFREAVKLCKSTLDITQDYRVLHSLARSEAELGDVELAEQHYQQALELCPQEDEKEKATIIHNFAIIYASRGDVDDAIALYQQSLELYEKIGDVQGKAASLHQLAIIYARRGDVDDAMALYQQSLELLEKIGDVQGKAASLHCLAGIYASRGDVDRAIALYQQSLELYERIGNVEGKAASLCMLGQLLADEKQDFTTALDYLQQSFEILQHIKSPDAEKVKEWIFKVKFKQLLQQSPEAQQLYQQLESADEDTSNQIISRLGELMNQYDNGVNIIIKRL